MDASELHARRLNEKGRVNAHQKCKNVFPVANGTVKTLGGDRRLRTSTLIRERPKQGEEQDSLRGESGGLSSPTPHQDDSTRDDAEAENDFWSITGDFKNRHHLEPRVKLYMPKEESFPIPLKYIDVTRKTRTSLDVLLEKILMITGTWMERELSEAWTDLTRFILLNERPPDGFSWSGERLTSKQTTSRPDTWWPEIWKIMARNVETHVPYVQSRREAKMDYRNTTTRQCQKITWYLLH